MEASPTRLGVLHSQAKQIIYNVNKYFIEEKNSRGLLLPITQAIERTARATNVGRRKVNRICGKHNQERRKQNEPEEPAFLSPKKKKKSSAVCHQLG